jgi:hypothetical protein
MTAAAQDVVPPIASPPAARLVPPGSLASHHSQPQLPSPSAIPEAHPQHDLFLKHDVAPGADDCDRRCHPCCRGWIDVAFFIGKGDNLPYVDRRFLYGVQAGAGYWIDQPRTLGLDASFFDAHGSYREYAGTTLIDSPLTLITADLNLRKELYTLEGFRLDGLVGYRYVLHREELLTGTSDVLTTESVRNRINAAQIGVNANYHYGAYFAEVESKAGTGLNSVANNINGTQVNDSHSCFIFEFGARSGYQLGETLWGTIGYTATYLDNIARPGQPETSYFIHGLVIGIEKRF